MTNKILIDRELLERVEYHLRNYYTAHGEGDKEREELRAALSAPQQEAVAWRRWEQEHGGMFVYYETAAYDDCEPLYTHPAPDVPEQEARKQLGELLAVIHGDGGHYAAEHGITKATADAIAKWSALRAAPSVPEGWQLIEECRSSVKFDLNRYERMALDFKRLGAEGKRTYDMADAEATRLHTLLEKIDAAIDAQKWREGMRDDNASQTPLVDLLRGVPKDAVNNYCHSTTHSQHIPVGRLCNEAADRIAALEAKARELEEERDRAKATVQALHHEYKIPFEVDEFDAPLKLCEVCGAPVLYGSQHHQCGSFVMNIETALTASRQQVWELEEDYSICKHSLERAKSNILAKNALITASRQRGQELEVELARVNEIYDQIELRALMAKDAFDRKRSLLERLEENFNELCRERDTFRKQVERLKELWFSDADPVETEFRDEARRRWALVEPKLRLDLEDPQQETKERP